MRSSQKLREVEHDPTTSQPSHARTVHVGNASDGKRKTAVPYRVAVVGVLLSVVGTMGITDEFVARTDRTPPLPLADAGPISTADTARSSTWFCAGGTGTTAVTALVANPTDKARTGSVRYVGPSGDIETIPISLKPGASESFEMPVKRALTSLLADQNAASTEVPADTSSPEATSVPTEIGDEAKRGVGAVFEFDGGGVTVEHRAEGSVAPCAAAAAPTWVLSDGTTTRDARTTMMLFNPFADDAIIDVLVATERGNARPSTLQGYVVPAGTVRTIDLERLVRRREVLTATVRTRTGRLVVEGFLRFDNTGDEQGSTIVQAAPSDGSAWYFPSGRTSAGESPVLREQYLLHNPNDRELTVEIEFISDSRVEPFEVDIPPRSVSVFQTADEERVPRSIDYSVAITSPDNRPFVASRRLTAKSQTRKGVASTLGARIISNQWTIANASATSAADDRIAVLNPTEEPALLTVFRVDPQNPNDVWTALPAITELPMSGGSRLSIRVGDFLAAKGEALVVLSDGAPVIVDRSRVAVRSRGERPLQPTLVATVPEGVSTPVDGLPDTNVETQIADNSAGSEGLTESSGEVPPSESTQSAARMTGHGLPLRGFSVAVPSEPASTSPQPTPSSAAPVVSGPSVSTSTTTPLEPRPATTKSAPVNTRTTKKSSTPVRVRVPVGVVASVQNGTSTAMAIPSAGS